jgi:hypothetical protein
MNKYNLIDSLSISFDINNEKDKKIIEFMSDDRLLPNLTSKFSTNKIYKNYDTYNYDNLNKYYNNTLQNVNLKRACCLRQDKNVDTYGDKEDFYVDFPDFNKENYLGYVSQKVVMTDLKNKCKKLSIGDRPDKVEFEGKSTEICDQFYKTYCKAISGIYNEFGKDLTKEKEYFRKIKYRDNSEAMECSCLNSPLINGDILFYNLKNRDSSNIDDRKIVYIDSLCGKEIPYQTNEQKSENLKRSSITICSMATNIGSARDIKLQGNVTTQDCGNTYVGDKIIDKNNKDNVTNKFDNKLNEPEIKSIAVEKNKNDPIELIEKKIIEIKMIENIDNNTQVIIFFIIGVVVIYFIYTKFIKKNDNNQNTIPNQYPNQYTNQYPNQNYTLYPNQNYNY